MSVLGRDCTIVFKTEKRELGLPYTEETLREAAVLLEEQASIEGDGVCRAIRKSAGIIGCVVTPLNSETVPFLLALAFGGSGQPVYVSESRNLYRHTLDLAPLEDGPLFEVIQGRETRRFYERCGVSGFELRNMRGQALSLKLDISGEGGPVVYPYDDPVMVSEGERFKEDGVRYYINDRECKNIYGLTITVRKDGGTKTEVRIHRSLSNEEFGICNEEIEAVSITARLFRDGYETGHYGMFRITLSRLVLMADETSIDSADAVIGPLRYYCAGGLSAEVYTENDEAIV
jgi:hypothetical protein